MSSLMRSYGCGASERQSGHLQRKRATEAAL
jgi:hypothetical protein